MAKVISDGLLIFISFVLGYYLRFQVLLFLASEKISFDQYFGVLIIVTLLWLALFKLTGIYEEKKAHSSIIDELAMLFVGVTLASILLLGLLFLYRGFWFLYLYLEH